MKLLLFNLLLLLISPFVFGQEITFEASISEVNKEVETANYDNALALLKPLMLRFPENEEIKIYSGRIYSWKKDFKTAIEILAPMTDRAAPNNDAMLAIINCYYWSQQYEKCLTYCNRYLIINTNSVDILIIKINCLESLNRDQEALAVLKNIAINDSNKPAIEIIKTRFAQKAKNAITVSYLNVSTANPGQQPLHYGAVEYLRKFDKSTMIGRANFGHANNETQMLFETDYYKTFSKKNYLYANAGISTGKTIFPMARLGIEYYFAPQNKFEYSVGFRHLNFDTSAITLFTGQLAYSIKASTFAYRPFYDTTNKLMSHVLSVQNLNEKNERIIRLELQYGNVPYLYLYNGFTTPLKAYRVGLQYQHRLGSSLLVRPVFLYEYEEYLPSQFRNRVNAQIICTKRF